VLALLRRDGWRTLGIGVGISIAVAVVVFAPLWAGSETFDPVREQAGGFITSTPHYLREWLKFTRAMEEGEAGSLAKLLGTLAFAATYAALLWAAWRQRLTPVALIACIALALLAVNLLALSWFRPWYMLWPLTALVLVPGRWALWLVLAISAGGMLPDLIEQYRNNVGFLAGHYLWAVAAPVIVAFVPAAVVWVVGAVRERTPLLAVEQVR
jgi:hypothetical protein